MAKLHNKKPEETPVILENVQFKRATIVSRDVPVRFLINVLEGAGEFEVCEGGAVAVTGSVRLAADPAAERLPPDAAPAAAEPDLLPLTTDDIYKVPSPSSVSIFITIHFKLIKLYAKSN